MFFYYLKIFSFYLCILIININLLQASTSRVLSITVVGEYKDHGIKKKEEREVSNFPQSKPRVSSRVTDESPMLDPKNLYQKPKITISSGAIFYRTLPGPTETTELVFDPVGSSFSVTGYEHAVSIGLPVEDFQVGLVARLGEASALVNARLENPNLRFVNTKMEVQNETFGVFFESGIESDLGASRGRVGLERSAYRVAISNDYRHGLFFGKPRVERRYRSTELVAGLRHDHSIRPGLVGFLGQSHRLPLGSGFGLMGSAVSLGFEKELGPRFKNNMSSDPPKNCRGGELFLSTGSATISGSQKERNSERSTDYGAESGLGWERSGLAGRYRFGRAGECGFVWVMAENKQVRYGTGYIAQLQPIVYTEPFESSSTVD